MSALLFLWLDCTSEKVNSKTVTSKLKCKICSEFEHNSKGRKNFSDKCGIAGENRPTGAKFLMEIIDL